MSTQNIRDFLSSLNTLGIQIGQVDGYLEIEGDDTALIDEIIQEIARRKADIIAYLCSPVVVSSNHDGSANSAQDDTPSAQPGQLPHAVDVPPVASNGQTPGAGVPHYTDTQVIEQVKRLQAAGYVFSMNEGKVEVEPQGGMVAPFLRAYSAVIAAWLRPRGPVCCRCDAEAVHTSPSGYQYCDQHYRCAAGHEPRWVFHLKLKKYICGCIVETQAQMQAEREQIKGVTLPSVWAEEVRGPARKIGTCLVADYKTGAPCGSTRWLPQTTDEQYVCAKCLSPVAWSRPEQHQTDTRAAAPAPAPAAPTVATSSAEADARARFLKHGEQLGYPAIQINVCTRMDGGKDRWELHANTHTDAELQRVIEKGTVIAPQGTSDTTHFVAPAFPHQVHTQAQAHTPMPDTSNRATGRQDAFFERLRALLPPDWHPETAAELAARRATEKPRTYPALLPRYALAEDEHSQQTPDTIVPPLQG